MAPDEDAADLEPQDAHDDDVGAVVEAEQRVPFGKYILLGKIARGGMAEIYRAISSVAPATRLFAVKCMRPHLVKEGRFVEMFIREGKLAVMLRHPGIVQTFDVGVVEGRYFIAMEYVSGQDLNTVLRRCQELSRRVPVPHALYIAISVCRALDYAHNLSNNRGEPLSVVNRDVSPSNIRISYHGEVKLLDFGIAQAVLQASSEIGILKGKFSYMSPEQVRGLPLDRRTDIFSAGIVLHEMLTCERLFRDESEFVLMEKVRRAEIRPPSSYNRRVPTELDAVVMRALDREPNARYQDAAAMAADLERLLVDYQFSSEEMGEFVRNLFPSDFREETEMTRTYLAGGTDELSLDEAFPAEDFDTIQRRSGIYDTQRRRGKIRQFRRWNALLMVVVVVLLVAALSTLMVILL